MHMDLASDPTRDGWLRTVSWLGNGGVAEVPRPTRAGRAVMADGGPAPKPPPTIHVLDRPTPRTAAISWSDPGSCHYGYQIWDMAPTKRAGVCVLSGTAILIGDMVYTPRTDEPSPINAGVMIAAAYVDA